MSTTTPTPPSPPTLGVETDDKRTPSRGGGGRAAGLVLVGLGLVWLLARLGVALEWGWILPSIVLVAGLLVLTGVGAAGRSLFLTVGVVAAVVALTSTSVSTLPADAVGDRAQSITTLDATSSEDLGIGSLQLDLRDLEPGTSGRLEASVGIGELVVILPPDLAVDVTASSGIGETRLFDHTRGGFGANLEQRDPPGASVDVELDLSVGIGSVRVQR